MRRRHLARAVARRAPGYDDATNRVQHLRSRETCRRVDGDRVARAQPPGCGGPGDPAKSDAGRGTAWLRTQLRSQEPQDAALTEDPDYGPRPVQSLLFTDPPGHRRRGA